MDKQLKHISKFISLVLRHQPEEIGLLLDDNGWASVEELIQKMNTKGISVDIEIIKTVVETNDKKRFAFNDDKTMIRASQGHSVEIDLALTAAEPPEFLYHGTGEKNVESILRNGIRKMKRQHVHLSKDKTTAINVGSRHGKPVVLTIHAGEMYRNGILFYLSDNAVWLTDFIETKYISA
ncbi:MAG: RNA 2'-phosphotransferase [Bacteroidota bacterium]